MTFKPPLSFVRYRDLFRRGNDPFALRALRVGGEDRSGGDFVLYWAQASRRMRGNLALEYAIAQANALQLPLVVYEALRPDYPSANDRLHTFVLEGVPETGQALKALGIGYYFYLRARRSDPNDVLYRLASRAYCVVTDDYPTPIAAQHNAGVAAHITVRYIAVDASCIVPMNHHDKRNYGAYTIRPRIKRVLEAHLKPVEMPELRIPHPQRHP